MSVLLRQPHGFEGFGVRDELLHAKDATRSKVEYSAGRRVPHAACYRRAALPPHAAVPNAGNNAILRCSYVLDLDAPVRPSILKLGGMATESVAPGVDSTPTWEAGQIVPLDLGIEELVKPFIAVAVRGPRSLEHRPHNLHVLLRHRPRSIAQAQDSA